ncbi:hypothetical protein HYALB_00003157 [Hymenoscyphus albidus]|uniref:Extracellular membrane protein CFEM domain-containing protein n=1 Tax=Hymenoscyphus albidus TaxID=595503 RepID=A0A9N9LAJ8_9HELO|nr:hypothetical protein HYALB_00003157 [Hymenoscyphus albidus]
MGAETRLAVRGMFVSCYQIAVVATGCGTDDILCQCGPASQTAYVQNILTTCLTSACTTNEILTYNLWAQNECIIASVSPTSTSTTSKRSTATPRPRTTTVAGGSVVTVTSTASTTSPPKKKSNLGIIIGSVVGGLVVIGLLCMAIIFCLWRRSKGKARKRAEHMANSHILPPQPTAAGHLPYQVPIVESKVLSPATTMVSPVSPMEKPGGLSGRMTPGTVEMQGEGRKEFVEMGGGEARKPVGGVGQEPAEMWTGGAR